MQGSDLLQDNLLCSSLCSTDSLIQYHTEHGLLIILFKSANDKLKNIIHAFFILTNTHGIRGFKTKRRTNVGTFRMITALICIRTARFLSLFFLFIHYFLFEHVLKRNGNIGTQLRFIPSDRFYRMNRRVCSCCSVWYKSSALFGALWVFP